jgi:hypothetical protein
MTTPLGLPADDSLAGFNGPGYPDEITRTGGEVADLEHGSQGRRATRIEKEGPR